MNNKRVDYFHKGARFPVMYLLHGAYGDYTDWARLTGIERYAQEHKLAVVMPSASNSFYQNMRYGSDYLRYILEELPRFIQRMFPVSRLREYTYTAGLSMGGYGALRVALEAPERYAAAISLSGAIDLVAVQRSLRGSGLNGPALWQIILEDADALAGTDADLLALAKRKKDASAAMPRLFLSCGTEDFIYPVNREGHTKFEQLGLDVTYEEHPGIHNWDYWDTHIKRAIQWLGLPCGEVDE